MEMACVQLEVLVLRFVGSMCEFTFGDEQYRCRPPGADGTLHVKTVFVLRKKYTYVYICVYIYGYVYIYNINMYIHMYSLLAIPCWVFSRIPIMPFFCRRRVRTVSVMQAAMQMLRFYGATQSSKMG